MAELSKNSKYITLEGFRASYRADDDTIHLTSNDPDFINGFHLTLKDGSPAEEDLRNILLNKGVISKNTVKQIPDKVFYPREAGDPYVFPLGVDDKGEVTWEPKVSPNLLLSGGTGKGKSVIERIILAHCASHPDKWEIYGIDLKQVELKGYYEAFNNFIELGTDLEDSLFVLEQVNAKIVERYTRMTIEGVDNFNALEEKPKAVMLLMDEVAALLELESNVTPDSVERNNYRLMIKPLFANILRIGRAAGIYVVSATQLLKAYSNEMLDNFGTRIVSGRVDSTLSALTLGSNEGTKVSSNRGRAVISHYGETTHFQAYWLSYEHALDR
jgi:hypothetical protein